MPQTAHFRLLNPSETRSCSASLTNSLYGVPVDILLHGELGTGKTTFLQGFAESLGVNQSLTSPTYALEQRYQTKLGEFIHIDLYRLTPEQSAELIQSTNDHEGIRCIEWAERLKSPPHDKRIELHFSEPEKDIRDLKVTWYDMTLPTDEQIQAWRQEAKLPQHIIDHCESVAAFAAELADKVLASKRVVRKEALKKAAQLHDLFRFIDFVLGGHPENINNTAEEEVTWATWKQRYAGLHHEAACTAFLQEQGFPELAEIVRTHGLRNSATVESTIEQQLLYYADKRVKNDQVVSLDERFEDFRERYGNKPQSQQWYDEVKQVEKALDL